MVAILQWLLPLLVQAIIRLGLPAFERDYPTLAPILKKLLHLLGGEEDMPSSELQSAGCHYNDLVKQPKL